jgi:quinol monooxygenase YgiN
MAKPIETFGERHSGRRNFIKTAGLAVGSLGFMRANIASADNAAWITITATLTLNPDNAEAAIEGVKEMVAAVKANEPGVLAYICNRGVEDRNEIMFFEIYENLAATEAHGKTSHMAKLRADGAKFFIGEMQVVPYQQLAGYHR